MEQKIPQRSELDPQYTWATTDLYPNEEAWEADIPKIQEVVGRLKACQGTLGQSAQGLLKFLQLEELQQPLGALSQSALAGFQAAHHFLNFGNVRLPGFLVGVQIGGGPGVLGIQFAPLGNFLLHKKISFLFRIHKCCRENLARRARAALKDGQAPDTNKR